MSDYEREVATDAARIHRSLAEQIDAGTFTGGAR